MAGPWPLLRSFLRNCVAGTLVLVTVNDRYASVVPVRGTSMNPTLESQQGNPNPKNLPPPPRASARALHLAAFCSRRRWPRAGEPALPRRPLRIVPRRRRRLPVSSRLCRCRPLSPPSEFLGMVCLFFFWILNCFVWFFSDRSPTEHRSLVVKRLIALPGDWIQVPAAQEIRQIPVGHCWVEGDNPDVSWDSRSYGPVRDYIAYITCKKNWLLILRYLT